MTNEERLLARIRKAFGDLPPRLVGMDFIRYVAEPDDPDGNELDTEFTWSTYVSHDPCHDSESYTEDRNTVIAIHRWNGTFKIIGRELPRKMAEALARGEDLDNWNG